MIQESGAIIHIISKNSTYEIDNGYIFSDIKKGNFYKISDFKKNIVTRLDDNSDGVLSIIALNADTESTHIQSSVYQIMDSIGTIGGIFELLLGTLLMIYTRIRKSLYYHSIIDQMQITKRDQSNETVKFKASETPYQSHDVASRDESKRMDHENNRLLNNLSNNKI